MKIRSVRLAELDDAARAGIIHRSAVPDPAVRRVSMEIVEYIKSGGDAALARAADQYGGGARRIEREEIERAWNDSSPDLRDALNQAAAAIRQVHETQLPTDHEVEPIPGVKVKRRWSPIRRVGGYVPGGLAAYPSSLLMIAVPAAVAGVGEVVIASPSDETGQVDKALLAAAHQAGVDEVFAMGGAQAIGALAFGTETIGRVDKIVGPGNAWVTAAKLAVFGDCDIDLPAGPSESLLLVDESADPVLVAADMACQAEHGPDSPVVLVTDSEEMIERVAEGLDEVLSRLSRRNILEHSLGGLGLVVLIDDWKQGIDFANEYAAEHVSILTADAESLADQLTGAGSVFVGHWAPESAGDYATGANHVLPTGGLARSSGPLSTEDFGSWRQEQTISEAGLSHMRSTISTLAEAEGLDAHRLAAEIRFERNGER